jgi:hypothetical protein
MSYKISVMDIKIDDKVYRLHLQTGAAALQLLGDSGDVVIDGTPRKVLAHACGLMARCQHEFSIEVVRETKAAAAVDADDVPSAADSKKLLAAEKLMLGDNPEQPHTVEISGNSYKHRTTLKAQGFYFSKDGNRWLKNRVAAKNLPHWRKFAVGLNLQFNYYASQGDDT